MEKSLEAFLDESLKKHHEKPRRISREISGQISEKLHGGILENIPGGILSKILPKDSIEKSIKVFLLLLFKKRVTKSLEEFL